MTPKELAEHCRKGGTFRLAKEDGMVHRTGKPDCECTGCELVRRGERIAALERDLADAKAKLAQICPHCGGRMDVDPGHIDRCYCLPVIRDLQAELQEASSWKPELDRLTQHSIEQDRKLLEAEATILRLRGGICETHIADDSGICPYCEAARRVEEAEEQVNRLREALRRIADSDESDLGLYAQFVQTEAKKALEEVPSE
jgi:hypothetical protein